MHICTQLYIYMNTVKIQKTLKKLCTASIKTKLNHVALQYQKGKKKNERRKEKNIGREDFNITYLL